MQGAKIQFELFLDSKKIPLEKITEDLCKNFQQYLLDKFNDKTPGNYFGRFKEVLAFAAHKGYFKEKISPAVMIEVKNNSSTTLKKILSEGQYQKIIKSIWDNKEVQWAFDYTGAFC